MSIITISTTSFSGGKEIAESIAARLGYACLNRKELIEGASEDFDFPETKLLEALEEPPKIWQHDRDKRGAHYNLIRAAFLRRCNEHGNLIYHGFAGQELIRRVSHVLRILVVADMEYRIGEAMKRQALDRDQAIALIKRDDKKITKWTQQMFGFNWKDPSLYDLVLHIGRIRPESAEEAIVQIVESEDFQPTAASRQAFDDELLGSVVWSILTKNEKTDSANVETLAENGHVTITGVSRSKEQKEAITTVTAAIEGVKEVKNDVGIGTIWRS